MTFFLTNIFFLIDFIQKGLTVVILSRMEEKGMSGLKRVLILVIASLFLAGIFAGCVSYRDTKWDPEKKQYVEVKK